MALCQGNYSSFLEHKQRTLFEETIQEKYLKRMKRFKDLRHEVRAYLEKEGDLHRAQGDETRFQAAQRRHKENSRVKL